MTWKESFLSTPSISIRKGIANNYDAPYEDTSTLVLTVPSHHFVDIRFPREILLNDDGVLSPLSSHPLFWAFSGTSSTSFYNEQDESKPGYMFTSHTVFKHDIDSKGPGITDEGDCFLLPNGDIMEIGISPSTGQLYKELWTEPAPVCGRKHVMRKPIFLAETVEDSSLGRGIAIRIGDYIQGIFEYHDESSQERVVVQRWIRDIYKEGEEPEWRLDPRSNTPAEGVLACYDLTRDVIFPGHEFVCQGVRWRVTECDC